MSNFTEIYHKAVADLEKAKADQAVLQSRIKERAEALGLDPSGNLEEQIQKLEDETKEKSSQLEKELDECLKKLEELDNGESFN